MPGILQRELVAAVKEVFAVMSDEPTVILRRFSKGTTADSVVSGVQARLPIGSPIPAVAILAERTSRGQEGVSDLFVRPEDLADAKDLTSPDDEWTVEEIGSDRQLDVRSARGGPAWRPFGPEPRNPVMWKARVVEGGVADA